MEKELLHRDVTKEIIDSAYNVHNTQGCGLLEKVYSNALIRDLDLKNKQIAAEHQFKVLYRDKEVGVYYADLVVDGKVIVEVKSVENIDDVHRAQLLNYLRISRLRVGLLINFSRPKLQYERFVV